MAGESFHPCVDLAFILELCEKSDKVEDIMEIGSTLAITFKGDGAWRRRYISIRHIDDQIAFEQAIAIGHRIGFLGEVLEWLLDNKNFKDGGFIVPQEKTNGGAGAKEK